MSAPVTRTHRLIALRADLASYRLPETAGSAVENHWVETGETFIGARQDRHVANAQALADIEAEAMADREHLEEGARVLLASHEMGLVRDTAYGAALDRWLTNERARRAKT